jgi:hypothetical protein
LVSEKVPRVFLLQSSHLSIFSVNFLLDGSESETWILFIIHIKLSLVKNPSSGSLYFHRYTLWKIGFLTSPLTSLKEVL